tara:strand:- start:1632 stop:1919 length:288 start_codon:yes stop_codon:yes gene_type:complete
MNPAENYKNYKNRALVRGARHVLLAYIEEAYPPLRSETMKIANNYEALVLALKLGITAKNDEQASRIDEHITLLASRMQPSELERAKAQALKDLT